MSGSGTPESEEALVSNHMEPKGVPQLPTRRGVISINTSQSVDKTLPKV